MPLNITRQNNGQVTLQYDQEVSLKIYFSILHLSASQVVYMGTGGFSVCKRAAHLCDETLSLKNWQTLPPDRVVQESISLEKTTILCFFVQENGRMLSIRIGHNRPLVLAYLWAETPVR